ncbi:MAG: ABC transporter substrate-binding protein [Thermomicrobiales bacterium]|nr:ABC transporter substrate-binding protein [Thermomicrobiales bacterium]
MTRQFSTGPSITRRKLMSTTATAAASISAMKLVDSLAAPNPGATIAFSRWQTGTNTFVLPVNGDPYRWPFAPAIPNILFNKTVYSGLIKYDLDGVTPIPDLATEWSTEDAITWTFNLRDDVTWHDGTPFTAEDVKFTFDAMLDPENTVTNRGVLVTLTSTEVVDPHTVTLTFSEPVASLPVGLGYLIFILPKHLLDGTDLNNPVDFVANPVGTGPFMFKEFVSGDPTTVIPNPDYFGQVAQVEAVVFKQVPDLNTQMLQIRTGELDVAFPEVQQLDAIEGLDTVTVTTSTPIQYFFIGFNNRRPIFQDKLVRQALAHAVDREAIVEAVIQGNATLATGPINPAIEWAYNPNVTTYDYDEDRARDLLAEAGWTEGSGGILEKDGEQLSFTIYSTAGNSTREQINTALQQYFAAVGADAKLEFLEPNVFDQNMFSFEFDALMHFSQLQPDPDLINYYGTDRGNNYFGYSNPEVDELLAQGRATVDQAERAEIYGRFQEILADDLPVIFFYYPHEIDVINNRVENYPPLDFRNATLYLNQITLSDAS